MKGYGESSVFGGHCGEQTGATKFSIQYVWHNALSGRQPSSK